MGERDEHEGANFKKVGYLLMFNHQKAHDVNRFNFLIALVPFGFVSAQSDGDFLEELGVDGGEFGEVEELGGSSGVRKTLSVDADLLFGSNSLDNSDIQVERYSGEFEVSVEDTTVGLSFSRTLYDIDVAGPGLSIFGFTRREATSNVALSLGQDWSESLATTLTLSGHEGFTNFRSIWLDEFFAQSTVGAFPGFEPGDPSGLSISLGSTYTFPNEVDSINVSLSYSTDRIAPGQAIEFVPGVGAGILRGDDVLDTWAANVTGNFYITNRITSQLLARASLTGVREVRTQLRANAAWQILQDLTLRGELGFANEEPEFEAFFGGITLSYQIIDPLTFSVGYRLYSDTGEITTANFNSAAPPLDSKELSASLLWVKGPHALSGSVAYFETDFDPVSGVNASFGQLFADRDFIAIRTAYTYQF